MIGEKQTCLKPIYSKPKTGKRGAIIRYEFDFPEIIVDDLGFEMQFGFPEPKDFPTVRTKQKEYVLPHGSLQSDYWCK
jgi:hypothetical protein